MGEGSSSIDNKSGTDDTDNIIVADDKVIMKQLGKAVIIDIIIVIAAVLLFIGFKVSVNTEIVRGISMEPTLYDSDKLISVHSGLLGIHRGDIVIIRTNKAEHGLIVKRVIGVPGDTIEIEDTVIRLNNEQLEEDYITGMPGGEYYEERELKEGEYFVLGDNRGNSSDSRDSDIGIIKESDIIYISVYDITQKKRL